MADAQIDPKSNREDDNWYAQQNQMYASQWPAVDGYTPMFGYTANPDSSTGTLGSTSALGVINIVENFQWTYSKYREEVPRIWMIERQIKNNQQLAFYLRNANIARSNRGALSGDSHKTDPYARLYGPAKKTGFSYIFPYYASSTVSLTQQWGPNIPAEQNPAGKLAQGVMSKIPGLQGAVDTFTDVVKGAAGIYNGLNSTTFGYEQPHYYGGPSVNSFVVRFPLYNTGSVADIRRNFDFIKMFSYQNYFERKSFATSTPPVIYECEFVTGHIGTIAAKPAVYVNKFDAKNIGAIRSIDIGIGSKVLIPEAYFIDISFSELVATSKNIFSSFLTGQSMVNVYED